ncbi:Flavin containing amine oxidoreductase [Teratosphaeria destructans]|uniref:Flavin containing amine oxidoreductase n=1 Tax=Teratosphaeria destructans TaxID=418781 RepID=A0A9W7SKG1_9PEZI|nr:Flavin containing amine oxidoreductase [Teratosphaeria destructans]
MSLLSKSSLQRQMNIFRRSPKDGRDGSVNTKAKRMAPATTDPRRAKIAVVGSGCAGLGAVWALRENEEYEVHVFEKASKLGGHTNTQIWTHHDLEVPVDTGFIVLNTATYPNFIRFLTEVGVETTETEMTFGVSRDGGKFEWSGESQGVFAQRRNLFRPAHWRMIFDIIRFNQFALDLLADDKLGSHRKYPEDMSIGSYLDAQGYCQSFRDDYLIPMTAAVWSTSPDKCSLEFPATTLVRFMWNHHLLSTIASRPPWLTIPGGSQRYIDAIVSQFPKDRLHLHTNCEVANVLRPNRNDGPDSSVTVSWIDSLTGRIEGDVFSHVILACHGDEILPLLAKHGSRPQTATSTTSSQLSGSTAVSSTLSSTSSPSSTKPTYLKTSSSPTSRITYISQTELDIFSSFHTTQNTAYLHSDLSLMPTRRKTWTAWNYLTTSCPSKLSSPAEVSLTYNMNILQHIPTDLYGDVLVTMNPPHPPRPDLTQGRFTYRHPLYTAESVRAQRRLPEVQGKRGVSFAGAWTKYGFHEDGFSSGLKVAVEHLGAKLPFEFVDSTYSRGHLPVLDWRDYLLRVVLLVLLFWLRVLDWVVQAPGVREVVRVGGKVGETVLNLGEYVGVL